MATTTTRKLRAELTPEERLRKGEKLAEIEQARATKIDRYRMIGRKHRAEVKELDEQIDHLVEDINNKSEEREIECRQEIDEQSGTLRTYRNDTDELIEERALTAEERQRQIPAALEPQGDGTTKTTSRRVKAERAKRAGRGLEVVESP